MFTKKRLTQQSRAVPRKRSQIEIKFEGNWSWGLVQETAEGGKEKGGGNIAVSGRNCIVKLRQFVEIIVCSYVVHCSYSCA